LAQGVGERQMATGSPASTAVKSSPQSSWGSPALKRAKSYDAWRQGWKSDAESLASAPRWSMGGKAGLHTPERKVLVTENVSWGAGGRGRDTWIQAVARASSTPGPGKYRTDLEFPMNKCEGTDWVYATDPEKSDTYNIANTRKERGPKYTLSRSRNETLDTKLQLSPLKSSALQVRRRDGTSKDVVVTPGPGHYTQPTQFGAASGGHRHHYFPESPSRSPTVPTFDPHVSPGTATAKASPGTLSPAKSPTRTTVSVSS